MHLFIVSEKTLPIYLAYGFAVMRTASVSPQTTPSQGFSS